MTTNTEDLRAGDSESKSARERRDAFVALESNTDRALGKFLGFNAGLTDPVVKALLETAKRAPCTHERIDTCETCIAIANYNAAVESINE